MEMLAKQLLSIHLNDADDNSDLQMCQRWLSPIYNKAINSPLFVWLCRQYMIYLPVWINEREKTEQFCSFKFGSMQLIIAHFFHHISNYLTNYQDFCFVSTHFRWISKENMLFLAISLTRPKHICNFFAKKVLD